METVKDVFTWSGLKGTAEEVASAYGSLQSLVGAGDPDNIRARGCTEAEWLDTLKAWRVGGEAARPPSLAETNCAKALGLAVRIRLGIEKSSEDVKLDEKKADDLKTAQLAATNAQTETAKLRDTVGDLQTVYGLRKIVPRNY